MTISQEELKINFNKNFKALKREFGYGPLEISKKTRITRATILNYEFSQSVPSYRNIIKIAEFFNVSIDFLLLNSENRFINYLNLFSLASKTNGLPSMQRNHIEDSIAQFINKDLDITVNFDDTEKYQFSNSFRDNFKQLREKNNLSQGDLSKLLNLKSRTSIANIERGSSKLPYELLLKISLKFNISLHYMVSGIPLNFKIDDNFLFKNLKIFDKSASQKQIQTVIVLMEQILKNNNIQLT